ncbi:mitochondrial outer membrane protein [Stemphylium lycopersici]|uniref:Mitochondrial outer membrane protein n=1 Tax=Stemphylium lycopersici TaxID=183478 RepID=A0A364N6C6_STELY|nr:mitochondrial outer membrane protein [Stemphylium lycopersici]RAR03553.1 mitochondrial outer membrane protein [Stemphylium lycopersici]RAR12898.1 mitochondrial outer membrane protein [Stemphylium lycopersici]
MSRSSRSNVTATSSRQQQQPPSSSIFSVPAPIKQLFDQFPLLTYPVNEFPQRVPQHGNAHVLYVFTTDQGALQGAPSYNPACLKWQAYLKFSKIPFRIASANNHASPSGSLPFLIASSPEASKQAPPIPSSKLQRWAMNNSDKAIEEPGDLRYEAYLSLLDHRIRRAWLYTIYLSSNTATIAEPLYILPTSRNPFVRLSIARDLRAAAEAELLKYSTVINEETLFNQADEAFAALDKLLGGDEWFFGAQRPGLFDASVFAYTHLLLDEGLGRGWVDGRLRDRVMGKRGLVEHRERCCYREGKGKKERKGNMTQPTFIDTSLVDVDPPPVGSKDDPTTNANGNKNSTAKQKQKQEKIVQHLSTQATYDAWAKVYDCDGNMLQAIDDDETNKLLPWFLGAVQSSMLEADKELRIVDIGCGTGRNTAKLVGHCWGKEGVAGGDAEVRVEVPGKMRQTGRRNISLRLEHCDCFPTFSASSPSNPEFHITSLPPSNALISTLVVEHVPLPLFFATIASLLLPRRGLALVTNMHADMASRSQAGFVNSDGVKVRGTSFVHTLDDMLGHARDAGFEVLDVREREVQEEDLERGVVGERGRKWVGVWVWMGFVIRRV